MQTYKVIKSYVEQVFIPIFWEFDRVVPHSPIFFFFQLLSVELENSFANVGIQNH